MLDITRELKEALQKANLHIKILWIKVLVKDKIEYQGGG